MIKRFGSLISTFERAHNTADTELFLSLFDDKIVKSVDVDQYETMRDKQLSSMGTLRETTFLGELQRNGHARLLYKATFAKSEDHFLITIIKNNELAPPKALGIWFS